MDRSNSDGYRAVRPFLDFCSQGLPARFIRKGQAKTVSTHLHADGLEHIKSSVAAGEAQVGAKVMPITSANSIDPEGWTA
jgi:hypothetical protein